MGNLSDSGIVFFSGGTALNDTARAMTQYTRATHIVTTFDSGGSSASLRHSLSIPAVGDIRARVLSLADNAQPHIAALLELFSLRLPIQETTENLHALFTTFLNGTHPAIQKVQRVCASTHQDVQALLVQFAHNMPRNFNLAGASIGNIVLASKYMAHGGKMAPAVGAFSARVHARGTVLAVAEEPAQLAVRLHNNTTLIGQHTFTGKAERAIRSPIGALWLAKSTENGEPTEVPAGKGVLQSIHAARCLCFPIGSFFSSVGANLLVQGVGQGIIKNTGKKVFVPNPGKDPELLGMNLLEQVFFLVHLIRKDTPEATAKDCISTLLVDKELGQYSGGVPEKEMQKLGIEVVHAPLIGTERLPDNQPCMDGEKLAKVLHEFAM